MLSCDDVNTYVQVKLGELKLSEFFLSVSHGFVLQMNTNHHVDVLIMITHIKLMNILNL